MLTRESNAKRLIMRLGQYASIDAADQRVLENALHTVHHYRTHVDLIHRGDATDGLQVIVAGFACRYKVSQEGRRQIVAFLLPGDLCDMRASLLKRMDHSIGTLSPVDASTMSVAAVDDIMTNHRALTRAFWCSTLIEESITREWVVNVGQRTSFERLAHLFCEVFARLQAVGLTNGDRCEMPLSQMDLADTLALSQVHVNRTLMQMRRAGLISFRNRELVIHDQAALENVAGFNADYLHLGEGREPLVARSIPVTA